MASGFTPLQGRLRAIWGAFSAKYAVHPFPYGRNKPEYIGFMGTAGASRFRAFVRAITLS